MADTKSLSSQKSAVTEGSKKSSTKKDSASLDKKKFKVLKAGYKDQFALREKLEAELSKQKTKYEELEKEMLAKDDRYLICYEENNQL